MQKRDGRVADKAAAYRYGTMQEKREDDKSAASSDATKQEKQIRTQADSPSFTQYG